MRKLIPLRITTFIGLSHFLIGIFGVGIVANAALYAIYKSGESAMVRESEDLAYVIANMLENPFGEDRLSTRPLHPADVIAIQNNIELHLIRRADVVYTVYDSNGSLIVTNALDPDMIPQDLVSIPTLPAEIQQALQKTAGSAIRDDAAGFKKVFVASTMTYAGQYRGIVHLGIPYFSAMVPTFRTMTVVALVGISIVFAIMWVGWRSSIYLSEPVVSLSRVAEQLSKGDLSVRADPQGPLEVIHLAVTLNSMTARLQNSLYTMQAFVANASHELRTPLTGIKLQVGALRTGALEEPEVAQRFLAQIECEIDRLGILVNDLLNLSQLESAGLGALQPVDLLELASEVQSFWEVRSHQSALVLSKKCVQKPPPVLGDPYQLRRLFDNLVDNAIKYTPPGGKVNIVLSIGHTPGTARIEVTDTGIGIPWEQQARIFDRFYRVETLRQETKMEKNSSSIPGQSGLPCSENSHGSGLGLAIAKTIVIAHGGGIGVQSQPGEGTTFWVELPAATKAQTN